MLLAITFWSPVLGQTPESQLGVSREAYSAAVDTWMTLQQDLPGELKRLPAEEAQAKLQAAEKARLAVGRARLDYLNGLKAAYETGAGRYKATGDSRNGTKALIEGADKEMLSDLDQATMWLDEEIRSASANRPRVAALQKQRAELMDLRSLIQRRGRDLERFESELSQSNANRAALGRAYGELAGWVASASDAAAKDEEVWAAAYAKMRLRIANQVSERPMPRREPEPAPTPPPTTPAAPPAIQGPASALVPNIGGIWVLNNPHARKLPSGAYEPASSRLTITQNGTEVHGSFECRFAVPANESHNPVVRFDFTGRITNPILRFAVSAPLKGTILIRPVDAVTLEVSYGISNSQKAGIDFGAVPEEGPQLLRRALR